MTSESWIVQDLEQLQTHGLERTLPAPQEQRGRAVDFSSNDYLGLARHPLVLAALAEAGRAGSGGSRLMSGTSQCHARLEQQLAEFKGREAALLFGAGYLANTGLIPALARRSDIVFSDRLVHASLIDGISLARCLHRRFRHNDAGHLESLLQRAGAARRASMRFFIVIESLYSMDGDIAPLADICRLAAGHDAFLIVDEAHALGIFGERGGGLLGSQESGSPGQAVVGTLSKALGSCGGFVASSDLVKRLLINRSRPFIFSTAPAPACVLAASAALSLIRSGEADGRELLRRAKFFRGLLTREGLNAMDSQSQIVPVLIGDSSEAVRLSAALRCSGLIAPAVRPPTVPAGTARLRFSLTLEHSEGVLAAAAETIGRTARTLGIV